MFGYYLDLAWRSLKRTPILTGLMVLAIGLGIGASMTMLTVLHVMTQDPLPGRSAHLYVPHIDPLPSTYKQPFGDELPNDNFTFPDAMALLNARRAVRQAAMAGGSLMVDPQRPDLQPFYVHGRYTTVDFFAMFGVPLESGSEWTVADDRSRAHVVVLSETLARKLFGRGNAIGKTIAFADNDHALHDFRVVGVTRDWMPRPQFYADRTGHAYDDVDQFFLPLSVAVDMNLAVTGNQFGVVTSVAGHTGQWNTRPTSYWLQFWVQLDTPAQVKAYRQFLVDYSAEQKSLGRFQNPVTHVKLYTLMGWLQYENLVPDDVRLQFWLAIGFLSVCMLNIVALLLAKFLRRSNEVSVRRAMGACKRDIFAQLGVESALVGVAGGAFGLGVAQIGLWSIRRRPDAYAHLATMDLSMLIGTVVLAIVASLLAGLLPAWRACHVPPALQLKTL